MMIGKMRVGFAVQLNYFTPQVLKNLRSENRSGSVTAINYQFQPACSQRNLFAYHPLIGVTYIQCLQRTPGSAEKIPALNNVFNILNLVSIDSGITQQKFAAIILGRIMTGGYHYSRHNIQITGGKIKDRSYDHA